VSASSDHPLSSGVTGHSARTTLLLSNRSNKWPGHEESAMSHEQHHATATAMTVHVPEAEAETRGTAHPHDPLTGAEIDAAREILVSAGLVTTTTRVPMLLPDEPTKEE